MTPSIPRRLRAGRKTRGERAFSTFSTLFLSLLSLIFLLPLLVTVSTSLVGEAERMVRGSFVLFPRKPDPSAYRMLLGSGSVILNAYGVTLFRVLVGTSLNLLFTALTSYGLTKRHLPGITAMTALLFFTMLFGGGLIPTYLVVVRLGLKNSPWVLIIPSLINTWYVFILRNFFAELPASLEEAAHMDGAGVLTILLRIVFPLSLPAFATIGMFYAVGHWNAWFDAAIYIDDMRRMPLQIILRNVVISATSTTSADMLMEMETMPPSQTIRSAMIVITTLPILLIYPFLQRYFISGMTVGAIKG